MGRSIFIWRTGILRLPAVDSRAGIPKMGLNSVGCIWTDGPTGCRSVAGPQWHPVDCHPGRARMLQRRHRRTFTPEDGLPGDRIRCMIEDSRGHLWVGTDRGVFHYNGKHFQNITSPHIGSVFQILEDRDGSFWFGTNLGHLVRYRLRLDTTNGSPPAGRYRSGL